MPYFILLIVLIISLLAVRRYRQYRKTRDLLVTPLYENEWDIIINKVPLCDKMPTELRPALEGKINVFLDQVEFIGCNGQEITEAMQLSIAAQASLMVVNTDMWYDTLQTVLVYPHSFKSQQTVRNGYVETTETINRIGESWARGPVILSWAHSKQGAINDVDGNNVVLHEFAHQLDALSSYTDCAPILHKDHDFDDWERVFTKAYNSLVRDSDAGRPSFLDQYGATAPAELFAVAVEAFFEKPRQMRDHEPDIYDQLSQFFRLDPVNWKNVD